MSTEQGHGVEVEIDSIRNVLAPTQTLRLALDVLRGNMLPGMATETVQAALRGLDERLIKQANANLRTGILSRDYFIVIPINPRNPPSPEDLEKVATAFRTLDDLGLIIIP
jgi:hypothetical protein